MTKTKNMSICHFHSKEKAQAQCVKCSRQACRKRCFLDGRTKYCKPCRDELKEEAPGKSKVMDTIQAVDSGLGAASNVIEGIQFIGSLVILGVCAVAYFGLKALGIFFE